MNKLKMTRRTFFFTAVIGSFLIVAMVTANTIWTTRQTMHATDEAVSAVSSFYLEAMADRRAQIISNQINLTFDMMEKALTFIEEEKVGSQEELQRLIGKLKVLLSLNRFALVDEDNIVYTQYTIYTGGSRHAFLAEEQLSGRIIDTVSQYGSSTLLCLAVPTPELSLLGKQFKACFVQIDIEDIVKLLALEDHSRTYFGLYTKNGTNLSGTELGTVIATDNIFESTKDLLPEDVWKENKDNFANGAEGTMRFTSEGIEETLTYIPVKETEWEIAVLIGDNVIQDQIRDISAKNMETTRNQMILTLASTLVLTAILLMELRTLSRERIEKEKETSRNFRAMANTDSMTGVRNKHAYSENEAVINERIKNKEVQKLSVVVCDINGLKYVNDTRGHAAGDKLIKDACAMVCEYFTHGAVFRVGGDEFVVILEGKGYDTMQEVISDLNRKVEENIKEDAVVVSIGYAVLEENDQRLRDVFERADKMMYERKAELKAMGAHTRNS